MGVKTQKQLAAETLQEQHKSDLVGCILSGEEEPSDLVMLSALYLSVNMEMEVIRWKEKGGCGWIDDNENKITKRRPTEGKKCRAKGDGSKDSSNEIR